MATAAKEIRRTTTTDGKSNGRAPLSREELRKMDAYWRASNYLSVGQIYLYDNPLLRKPLTEEHVAMT
jgi:xylulose-5-phosphate/fructose-6-phosphate phosphoketolase